ncbi:hypothetical protein VP01_387g7 [Puccinia sorghi]|uniref:DUF7872 domain-containing protein n=1 Tax=Puccinia sorghi TaxID=27349 RepID=A0A0L6UTQ3_9BASI|nr:hypothetical protein VP01_387g7 [Puccinia sorghi]
MIGMFKGLAKYIRKVAKPTIEACGNIPGVNGHALQVSGRQTSKATHLLRPRAKPHPPTKPYDCEPKPLSPQTWKELELDAYLETYPNGNKLTLNVSPLSNLPASLVGSSCLSFLPQEYARIHGALNFMCGMNTYCSAGQLCSPISGRSWWVLAAVEQLTFYENRLSNAIDFAASQAKAIGAELVADLYDQSAKKKARLFQNISMILTLALAVVSAMAGAVFLFVPGLQAFAVMATAGAVVAIGQATMIMAARAQTLEAGRQDQFTHWAAVEGQIADWASAAQTDLQTHLAKILSSPISTPDGISGALKNGEFCRNSIKKDTNDLERDLSGALTARMVGQILRAKVSPCFITMNVSHDCHYNGPNGALSIDDGWLSYCNKDGLWPNTHGPTCTHRRMLNVIYDDNGKSGNHFYNAKLLVTKYNITPEYITTQALKCSQSGVAPDYDPYAHGAKIVDRNSPCLINLPICNVEDHGTTLFSYESSVHKIIKHHSTVKACRKAGHISLP